MARRLYWVSVGSLLVMLVVIGTTVVATVVTGRENNLLTSVSDIVRWSGVLVTIVITLIVTYFKRRNNPYATFTVHILHHERYALVKNMRYWIRECSCVGVTMWFQENGVCQLTLKFATREGTPHEFNQYVVFNDRLVDLLDASHRLASASGEPSALPTQCLFDNQGVLCGIIVPRRSKKRKRGVAYMF